MSRAYRKGRCVSISQRTPVFQGDIEARIAGPANTKGGKIYVQIQACSYSLLNGNWRRFASPDFFKNGGHGVQDSELTYGTAWLSLDVDSWRRWVAGIETIIAEAKANER